MSACEQCQDRLLDYVEGELASAERRRIDDHLADCEVCAAIEQHMREGLALAAALPLEEPPHTVTDVVVRAARKRSGEASTSVSATASTSMLPLALSGRWGRARAFVVRPQFVMATVMLLAVAFGAWYVPQRTQQPSPAASPLAPSVSATASDAPVPSPPGPAAEPPPGQDPTAEGVPAPAPLSTAARLERGLQAYGRSDYVAAIDALNAVVSSANVDDDAWTTAMHHLARSYQQNGDCRAATRRYEQLLRRSPAYNQIYAAMLEAGACYRTLGDDARARELLELAVEDPASRVAAQAELDQLPPPPRARRPSRAQAGSRANTADRPPATMRPPSEELSAF